MAGGLVTSFVLELLVYPVLFVIWKSGARAKSFLVGGEVVRNQWLAGAARCATAAAAVRLSTPSLA
jgi:hypothetical protein